jgi:hypothetical protein
MDTDRPPAPQLWSLGLVLLESVQIEIRGPQEPDGDLDGRHAPDTHREKKGAKYWRTH